MKFESSDGCLFFFVATINFVCMLSCLSLLEDPKVMILLILVLIVLSEYGIT